ncbi:hypothetical protein [Methylobacterium soli]|uniref:Uncharacterized protein n=1 Tax=Methylobacterium soli TaxID=553447 RepID=A0A6L3TBX5_9HYPH|nr:hypothetical protein [Methylobacterium soli]KAB1081553.1 hypothetical protein F6X53_00115 [Methylobacterium soli]GJE46057.1 hypothetical protein AEGHOMDF_5257 [Methylobacterium soli]
MIDGGQAYADDCILFRNDEWCLSGEGLEHRATGYFIPRASIGARRHEGLWEWPLHMAEKRWCTPSLFREAFLVALDRFAIARDGILGHSFALGFGIRAGQPAGSEGGFLSLGEIVRPKSVRPKPAPRRPASEERPARSGGLRATA